MQKIYLFSVQIRCLYHITNLRRCKGGNIMFFIWGWGSSSKTVFTQTGICKHCGHMCCLEVFMTYHYFSLFFIPLLKWDKQYYVKSSCCGAVHAIPPEIGKALSKGDTNSLSEDDLSYVMGSAAAIDSYCGNCGAPKNDNAYCTKCGAKL